MIVILPRLFSYLFCRLKWVKVIQSIERVRGLNKLSSFFRHFTRETNFHSLSNCLNANFKHYTIYRLSQTPSAVNETTFYQLVVFYNFIATAETEIECATHKKGPYVIYPGQSDQGLHSPPLKGSINTVVYVDEQRMPSSDYTAKHADLDLCCSHMN